MPIDLKLLDDMINKEGGENRSPINVYEDNHLKTNGIVNSIITSPYRSTITEKEYDAYNKYGVLLSDVNRQFADRERAEAQSWKEQLGHSLEQLLVKEIILGTVKGVSDTVDALVNIGKENNDFTNPVSQFIEQLQDANKERFDIYQKNPGETFQFDDFGWWAENLVQVGSSVALMLPSLGGAKALGALGKFTEADKALTNLLTKASKIGQKTKKSKSLFRPNVASANIQHAANATTAALISRTAENYQEGREVYKNVVDKVLEELNAMNPDERAAFYNSNTNGYNSSMSDREIAEDIASKAGYQTFKDDYAMLLMDVLQYQSLGKMFRGATKNANSLTNRVRLDRAVRQLSGEELEELSKIQLFKEALKYGIKNPEILAKDIITGIPFTEGIEEGYQGIVSARSEELADMILDPNYSARSISSYLNDSSIWEQAFWGIAAGALFEGAGKGLSKIKNNITENHNKKKLTENAQAAENAHNAQSKHEIETWVEKSRSLAKDLEEINNGYVPVSYGNEAYERDENGKIIIDTETGANKRKTIDETERTQYKVDRINRYLADSAMNALDKGYYDLFKEFINNDNYIKYLREQGVQDTDVDKFIGDNFKERLDLIEDTYLNAVELFYSNIDNPSPYLIRLVARDYTKDVLNVNAIQEQLNDINEELNNKDDYKNLSAAYINRFRSRYISQILETLDQDRSKYLTLASEGKISQAALRQYLKENDKSKLKVLTVLNNFKLEEAVDEESNKIINELITNTKKDINNLINEVKDNKEFDFNHSALYNSILDNIDKITEEYKDNSVTALSETTRHLLAQQADRELEIAIKDLDILQSKDQLAEYYKELHIGFDRYLHDIAKKSLDEIENYIQSHKDNLDDAYKRILDENFDDVSEKQQKRLKDASEVLKIGHTSTEEYALALQKYIEDLKAETQRKEEESRIVVHGNNVVQTNTNTQSPAQTNIQQTQQVVDDTIDSSTGSQEAANDNEIDAYLAASPQVDEVIQAERDIDAYIARPEFQETETIRRVVRTIYQDIATNKDSYLELLKNIKSLDTNDPNYNELISRFNEFIDKSNLSDKGKELALKEIISWTHKYTELIFRNTNDISLKKTVELFNSRIRANKNDKFSASILTTTEEQKQVLDEIIEEYAKNNPKIVKKDGNYRLNLKDFISYILKIEDNSEYLSLNDVISFLDAIKDLHEAGKVTFTDWQNYKKYINNPESYVQMILDESATIENIDRAIHASKPKLNASPATNRAIERAKRGEGVNKVNLDDEHNNIVIKNNRSEIGFMSQVTMSEDGLTYRTKGTGFRWQVALNQGKYTTQFDKLFIKLIESVHNPTSVDKKIFDIIYNYNPEIGITEDEANQLIKYVESSEFGLGNNFFSKNDNADLVTTKNYNNAISIGQFIAYNIQNILTFNQNAEFDVDKAKAYFEQWKERLWNNYKTTKEIENALREGKEVQIDLISSDIEELNYTDEEIDVNPDDFITEDYKGRPVNYLVVAKSENGELASENVEIKDVQLLQSSSRTKIGSGSMGIVVHQHNGVPFVAKFTSSNNIMSDITLEERVNNSKKALEYDNKLGTKIIAELNNLIQNYYNNKIGFEELKRKLVYLFGNTNAGSYLTYGVSVIKNANYIMLVKNNYNDNNYEKLAIIYNDTDKFKRGVAAFDKDGNIIKPRSGKKYSFSEYNEDYVKTLVNKVVAQAKYNRSFFPIDNANVPNLKLNDYFYKENGKLYIMGKAYNTYLDYILEQKAFKVNVKKENGSFTHKSETAKDGSIYIDANYKVLKSLTTSGEQYEGNKEIGPVIEEIEKATEDTPVKTLDILKLSGLKPKLIDILFDKDLQILDDNLYFDNNPEAKGHARFNPTSQKIFITRPGLEYLKQHPNEISRLIIHENFHKHFNNASIGTRVRTIEEIIDTYNQFKKFLDNYKGNDSSILSAKNFIEKNPHIFDRNYSGTEYKKLSDVEFAEEWLTESFTRDFLADALNKVSYDGEIKTNENKSLLQKIVEAILNLFNKVFDNLNKKSILAKQYSILGEEESTETTQEIAPITNEGDTSNITPPVKEEPTTSTTTENSNTQTNTDTEEADYHTAIDNDEEDEWSASFTPDNAETIFSTDEKIVNSNFEKIIEDYANGIPIPDNYFISYENDEKFLSYFDDSQKPLIADLIKNGTLKRICR